MSNKEKYLKLPLVVDIVLFSKQSSKNPALSKCLPERIEIFVENLDSSGTMSLPRYRVKKDGNGLDIGEGIKKFVSEYLGAESLPEGCVDLSSFVTIDKENSCVSKVSMLGVNKEEFPLQEKGCWTDIRDLFDTSKEVKFTGNQKETLAVMFSPENVLDAGWKHI